MIKYVFVFFILATIMGCSAVDSIKIGGGYTSEDGTKIEGDVEVVLSEADSKELELPVMISSMDKYLLLSEKQIEKIVSKIEVDKKDILKESSFKKIKKILKEK